jgi:hypothetical protein
MLSKCKDSNVFPPTPALACKDCPAGDKAARLSLARRAPEGAVPRLRGFKCKSIESKVLGAAPLAVALRLPARYLFD